MTQALHARPYLSLEDRRDVAHQQDTNLNSARLAFADELHSLRTHWSTVNSNSSTREFIQWFCYGDYQARIYSYLRAGLARARHQWPDALRLGELADIGQVLESGLPVGDVVAVFTKHGMDGVRLLKPKKDVTRIEFPTSVMPEVREIMENLSGSDGPAAERHAAALLALGSLPDAVQRAGLAQHETGQDFTSALISAEDKGRDYRAWLATQGCAVCGVHPVELHHLKAGSNARFRTHDVLLPLCARHHRAEPGTTPAVHAASQDDWATTHFGSPAALWQRVALTLTTWAEAQRGNR